MTPDANFAATLTDRARAQPHTAALIEPNGRRVTFAELESLFLRYAHGLERQGVRHGDRVLYMLPPSIDGYAVFYALLRIGAVPVLMDPRMGFRRLIECISTVRPRVIVAAPLVHAVRTFLRRPFAAAEILITAGRRWFWGGARLADCLTESGFAGNGATAPEDASFLPFTSGSTGAPKGAFYNHAMLGAQMAVMREVCGWREGMRVVMAYAPFVPYALADGLTTILPDMDFSRPATAHPAMIARAITEHSAECAFGSPVIWMHLVRYCERQRVSLPTLERAVTAGAPISAALHRRLSPLLHRDGRLFTPYGATEAMPLTTANSAELSDTWDLVRRGYGTCVGRPLTGVDLRVIRVTDDPVPEWSESLRVPDGTIGEIVAAGPLVSPSYPDRPGDDARAKIRCDGRVLHRMGDLGWRDAAGGGRLWFCGRKSDRIETRQGMIPSQPLENILNDHPAVYRSAVVGIGSRPDQRVVACVELEPGQRYSPRLASELAALPDGTRFERVITRILPHSGFPVDARHNSKIRRDALAVWAERQCARS